MLFTPVLLCLTVAAIYAQQQQQQQQTEHRRRKGAGPGEWGPPARDRGEFFPPPPPLPPPSHLDQHHHQHQDHLQQQWGPGGPGMMPPGPGGMMPPGPGGMMPPGPGSPGGMMPPGPGSPGGMMPPGPGSPGGMMPPGTGGPGGMFMPGVGGVPPHNMMHHLHHHPHDDPRLPPVDQRTAGMTRMHANMRTHVRERSDHFLSRIGQSSTLQPDEKTAIKQDIEELHTLEGEVIDSREKMMLEFESFRDIPNEEERNQKSFGTRWCESLAIRSRLSVRATQPSRRVPA